MAAGAARSAIVTLIFLGSDDVEVSRQDLVLEPQPVPLGTVHTDADGGFSARKHTTLGGRLTVDAGYDGALDRWPAYAEATVH